MNSMPPEGYTWKDYSIGILLAVLAAEVTCILWISFENAFTRGW
jgi:hypothetical protein